MPKALVNLYVKKSKEKLLSLYKKGVGKGELLCSIDIEEFGDFKELIAFIEILISTRALFVDIPDRQDFVTKAVQVLSSSYNNDPEAYIDFLNSYPITEFPSLLSDCDLYVLYNYLPFFYKMSAEIKAGPLKEGHGPTPLYQPLIQSDVYSGSFAKYVPDLIRLNPSFAKFIYDRKTKELCFFDEITEKAVTVSLIDSGVTPEAFHLAYKVKQLKNNIGEHGLFRDYVLVNKPLYSVFKHKEGTNTKKSLVIYGYEEKSAFRDITALNLFLKHYDVLVVDARDKIITTENIALAIREAGFNSLNAVHILMHGSDPFFVSDTLLTLNCDYLGFSSPKVMASDLFKLIMHEIDYKPIQAVIHSCNGQLLTHKIADILPAGSEIITFAENQEVNGHHYKIEWNNRFFIAYDEFYTGSIRVDAAKANYYYEPLAGHGKIGKIVPSPTYAQLGKCNFRTTVNLSKNDIAELLSKTSLKAVIDKVSAYLSNGERVVDNEIKSYTKKLITMVNSSIEHHPLLSYRSQDELNADFHKYLGLAGAIYGIYDQCGEGLISDSDFKPNKDSFLSESFLNLMPDLIGHSICLIAGNIIKMIDGETD